MVEFRKPRLRALLIQRSIRRTNGPVLGIGPFFVTSSNGRRIVDEFGFDEFGEGSKPVVTAFRMSVRKRLDECVEEMEAIRLDEGPVLKTGGCESGL